MLFAWLLSMAALAFGAALGARALIDPHWAARFVRLKADDQGGGFAEFRATYGGVFLGIHAAAFLLALRYVMSGGALIGVLATGAVAVLCAAWAGAAFGRFIAILRDGADTRFNRMSIGAETATAIAIGMPWFVWLLS